MSGVAPGQRLASQAARGAVWALLGSLTGKLVWLAALAVLARFVSPAEFGLVAFGLVTITYLEALGDLGSGAALIYWPRRDQRDVELTAQATFGVNLGMGTLFCLVLWLAAPWVAEFFRHPEGVPILRVLALGLPIKYLGTTHDALLRKQLRFRRRALPEAALSVVKASIAVPLALAGWGAWSLVWGQVGGLAAWTLLLWGMESWRPKPPRRAALDRVPAVLRYGRGIVAVNLLAAIVHHADLVIVGRMLGATTLGFYQIAYKLPEMTLALAIWVSGSVMFPTLSRMHGRGDDLAVGLRSAVRHTTAVTFPLAAGLAVVAQPTVRLVFGPDWLPAAPLLAALAIYLGIRSWGSPGGDLMKSTGKTDWLAGLALARSVVLLPALIVAASYGAVWVARTMAAMAALSSAASLALAARIGATSFWRPAAAALPALGASLAMVAVLAIWHQLVPEPAGAVGLAARVFAGAAVYALVLRMIAPDLIRDAWKSLRGTALQSQEARAETQP